MKEQRFEKVVRWKEKPDSIGIIITLIILGLAIANLCYGWGTQEELEAKGISDGLLWVITLNVAILLILSIFILNESRGNGREVYWRKII